MAQAHQAAERIDLPDQMPLRGAADRGIARHVRDRAHPTACRSRRAAQARGGPRRFDAGMPGADHDHVEARCIDFVLTIYFPMQNLSKIACSDVVRRRGGPVTSSSRARASWTSASTNSSGTPDPAAVARARRVHCRARVEQLRVADVGDRRRVAIRSRCRRASPTIAVAQLVHALARSARTPPRQRSPRSPATPRARQIALVGATITRAAAARVVEQRVDRRRQRRRTVEHDER